MKPELKKKIEISEVKDFWKSNNKVIYLMIYLSILGACLLWFLNSEIVTIIRTQYNYSLLYLVGTATLFTAVSGYVIHFKLTEGVSQKYTTGQFDRFKEKMAGISWQSVEEPFKKKK